MYQICCLIFQESCYSKMEKADILEMTVAHLKNTQFNPISSPPTSVVSSLEDAKKKYLLGFNECAKEVGKYLSSMEELAVKVGAPLMKHLISCLENIQRYQVSITPSDLQPTAGGKPAMPEDYSISFASMPGTFSDFSGSARSGVGAAVPVALNMESYTAMLAFCDSLRTVGKLSPSALPSPASDVTENSSVSSSGTTSSSCCQNFDSQQEQGLSRWRTSSSSEEGSALELGSSSMPVCHSIFSIPSIYSVDSQMSRRFVSSVPVLIPAQNGTCTDTGSPVKNEVFPCNFPSDGSIWRPW